ncbi:MAG: hypothetical protein KC431_22725, partial [Myxococcales bacterium]|nr:hypothetical protein [Myxococcales bacterium]
MKIATAHGRGETRVGVGEAHAALVEALGGPPDWMVIHSSVRHRAGELRAVLAELGAAQIHGCSSCLGVMSGEGFDPEAIGLFALRDPEGDFGVGSALLGDDPARAAGAALQQAIEAAGRSGELPGLVWVSAAPGHEEACIAGIEALIGTGVPIVGGSAA